MNDTFSECVFVITGSVFREGSDGISTLLDVDSNDPAHPFPGARPLIRNSHVVRPPRIMRLIRSGYERKSQGAANTCTARNMRHARLHAEPFTSA